MRGYHLNAMLVATAFAATALLAHEAAAQPGGNSNAIIDGAYNASATWDANGVPGGTADAQVAGGLTVTSSASGNEAFRILLGDDPGGSAGTLRLTGGTLATDKVLSLGGFETATTGTGNLFVSGGQLNVGGIGTDGGVQNLNAGDVAGTTGNVTITGGQIDILEDYVFGLQAAAAGVGNQSVGAVTANNVMIGNFGIGDYTLSSGDLTAAGSLIVANFGTANGMLTQSGGNVKAGEVTIADRGGAGSYTMSGGTFVSTNAAGGTGRLFVGRAGNVADQRGGSFIQSGGTVNADGDVWVGNVNDSSGIYSLSGAASSSVGGNLNVAAAAGANGSATAGVAGTVNIAGSGVSLDVSGNLVANGASLTAGDPTNASLFNFTTDAVDDGVSSLIVGGSADIDGAVFDITETNLIPLGTVFDLVTTVAGINNFGTATLGPHAAGQYHLQLGGAGTILQAVKGAVPEPASLSLLCLACCGVALRRRGSRA